MVTKQKIKVKKYYPPISNPFSIITRPENRTMGKITRKIHCRTIAHPNKSKTIIPKKQTISVITYSPPTLDFNHIYSLYSYYRTGTQTYKPFAKVMKYRSQR